MGLISVKSNEGDELFKPLEFPVIPKGTYLFAVAKLEEGVSEAGNKVLKLEARSQDEGETKGMPIFHNFVLIDDAQDEKTLKAKKINDAQLAQFLMSVGVGTQEEIASGKEVNPEDLVDKAFKAKTGVRINEYQGEKRQQAYIQQFLFEPATA